MAIKGFRSSKKLKKVIPNVDTMRTEDIEQYVTLNQLPSDRVGVDVIMHGLYAINSTPVTPSAGSDLRKVVFPASHNLKAGDVLRFITNQTEAPVLGVIDSVTVILACELDFDPTTDTVTTWRYTTPSFDKNGALATSGAVSYNRKSAGVTLSTTVLEDLDTPAASRPMPVAIHSIDGAGITVNAGDLSVSTSHVNDSMSIGDGTRIVAATTNNELKVRDNDTITAVGSTTTAVNAVTTKLGDGSQKTKLTDGTNDVTVKQIGTQVTATDYGIVNNAILHAWSTAGGGAFVDVKANPSGELTVAASVTSSVLPTGAATESTLGTQNVLIGAVTETAPATDTASSGLNGRLQRIAQRLSSIIGLLPASLGQKVSASSLAVVIASDNTVSVSAVSLPLPTGASTSALQTTGNTSLSNIDTKLPASLGAKTSAASLSVTPASDAIFNIKPKAVTGTFVSGNVTTVTTLTAPANAIGALIQCPDTSANNFRALQGGTATASVGIQFQPGRSEDFRSGTDISICSELGTAAYSVQWFVQA